MMLFKLSLKNITKSLKDYAIYFFTLILGVSIFYIFNAIDSQTVMMNVSKSTYEIIKLMTNMLSGVSIFVSVILGFLIIYASRFLIKRRNKEFGIYLTLGMSKRKISLLLFVETVFIGIIPLVVGLLIGICLSQLMSILVVNMFDADMTKFKFTFSSTACIKTLFYFSIMYLLVMIFNTVSVSKVKLINLIYSNKKAEKVKLKNPYVCIIIFIISVIALSYSYYLVTSGFSNIESSWEILIPIILGAVSTFFIFWSLSGLILKIVMLLKKVYYKGLNSFILRQISSKVNTTVFSMTIICLMLFITICVLSSSLSLKNSMTYNINKLTPVDVQIIKQKNVPCEYKCDSEKIMIDDSYLPLSSTLSNIGINLSDYFKNSITINTYKSSTLTLNDLLGKKAEDISKKSGIITNNKEKYIKISDYNKLAKYYNHKTYNLNDNEYIVVADYKYMVDIRNIGLANNTIINLNGFKLKPKYNKCENGFIEIGANYSNTGILIVPDNVVNESDINNDILVANYKTNRKKEKSKLDEELNNIINSHYNKDTWITLNTKIDITNSSTGLGALVTFIGLYLGIIFLISSAAILALKELSESTDNKERYNMLRKLGADEKMINKALFKQIGIFFMFPLLIAIIHSIFGIKFCSFILETFGNEKLLPSILMTAIFLIIIYGGYFIITYWYSKSIIKEKKLY